MGSGSSLNKFLERETARGAGDGLRRAPSLLGLKLPRLRTGLGVVIPSSASQDTGADARARLRLRAPGVNLVSLAKLLNGFRVDVCKLCHV